MLKIGEYNVYIGDMHIHTNYSDGDNIIKVFDRINSLGYDFVAITDHDEPNGSLEMQNVCRKLGSPLLVINGSEISSGEGHILSINSTEKIPVMPDLKESCRIVREKGGIAIAAHPYWEDIGARKCPAEWEVITLL